MSAGHRHGSADCRGVFERLSEYIDEELARDVGERIEGHMEDCEPCQEFLESLRRTVRIIETVERPTLPDEVRREVREAYSRLKDRLESD